MKDRIVTHIVASLAKEKGFYLDCEHGYHVDDDGYITFKEDWWLHLNDHYEQHLKETDFIYGAPTQSLLQKWIREEHDIVVYVLPHAPQKRIDTKVNLYSPCLWYKNEYQSEMNSANSYELALEIGLQEALKLIK